MAEAETAIITPRRNFLIRALGFTAAGASVAIPIVTLADAKARMEHHQRELERAWRDYYGPEYNVRTVDNASPVGVTDLHRGQVYRATSVFMVCAGGGAVV